MPSHVKNPCINGPKIFYDLDACRSNRPVRNRYFFGHKLLRRVPTHLSRSAIVFKSTTMSTLLSDLGLTDKTKKLRILNCTYPLENRFSSNSNSKVGQLKSLYFVFH